MGEKDSHAREYFGDARVFADVFNTLCFNGRQVIEPERLEPMPADVVERNLRGRRVTFSRDLLMRMTGMGYGSSMLVLLGLEHQSYVNYEMPLRCLHYDVLSLLQQCRRISRARTAGDSHFPGELRPGERLAPVITAVVYVGSEPWDGPCSLREMMTDIPRDLEPFVLDYRMLLLTPESVGEDMFPLFQSDLGIALYYARLSTDSDRMMEFLRRARPWLSRSAVEFLNASLKTKIKINPREEKVNMCKAWEDQFKEGRLEGERKGRLEGERKGRLEGQKEGRLEVARRLAEDLRLQKNADELCAYLQKIIGITYEQAQACIAAVH